MSEQDDWIEPSLIRKLFNVGVNTLRRWTENCPSLGRPVGAKPNPRRNGHFVYSRADLEAAVNAVAPLAEEFWDEAGRRWLWEGVAGVRFGIGTQKLREWNEKGCPLLGGEELEMVRKRMASPVGGKPRERYFFLEEDLEALVEARTRVPEGWARSCDLSAKFGIANGVLQLWRTHCPALGRPIRNQPDPADPTRKRIYLLRDVEHAVAAPKPDGGEFTDEAGNRWVSVELAAERYGYSEATLRRWQKRGCPLMGDHKLAARRKPGVGPVSGRLVKRDRLYLRADQLQALADLRKHGPAEDPQWLTAGKVAKRFGWPAWHLKTYRTRKHPLLGRRIRGERHVGIDKAGTSRERWVYFLPDLEELAAKCDASREPGAKGWLTTPESEAEFGFDPATLNRWREVGCPMLEGKKLQGRREWVTLADGRTQHLWKHPRSQLELISERRDQAWDGVHRDDEGTWLSQKVACDQYEVPLFHLWKRNKPNRLLDGDRLRAKRVKKWMRRNSHGAYVWVYHEDDIRRMEARLKRWPAPRPAKPAGTKEDPLYVAGAVDVANLHELQAAAETAADPDAEWWNGPKAMKHSLAFNMLGVGDDLHSKQKSDLMEKIRDRARDALRTHKNGNVFLYHAEDWDRVCKLIRSFCGRKGEERKAVDAFVNSPVTAAEVEGIEQRKAAERKRKEGEERPRMAG